MQPQLEAVREVSEFLDRHGIRHFVIGGIANAVWGNPRATRDADFKILIGDLSIAEMVGIVGQQFQFRVSDALAFAQRTYVLPIVASNQVEVDIELGFLPDEEQAIERGLNMQREGVSFAVCTAEDLIIQKAVSERERDWDDISGVLKRQGSQLDQNYINRWLEEFAQALDRPEMVERYQHLRKKLRV
jgi:predicted nucleotidyltransferase